MTRERGGESQERPQLSCSGATTNFPIPHPQHSYSRDWFSHLERELALESQTGLSPTSLDFHSFFSQSFIPLVFVEDPENTRLGLKGLWQGARQTDVLLRTQAVRLQHLYPCGECQDRKDVGSDRGTSQRKSEETLWLTTCRSPQPSPQTCCLGWE